MSNISFTYHCCLGDQHSARIGCTGNLCEIWKGIPLRFLTISSKKRYLVLTFLRLLKTSWIPLLDQGAHDTQGLVRMSRKHLNWNRLGGRTLIKSNAESLLDARLFHHEEDLTLRRISEIPLFGGDLS